MTNNEMPESRKTLHRMKPYVPGKSIQEVAKQYNLKHVTKMASNENPLGCAIKDISLMQKTFNDLFYYPVSGNTLLKEKIAQKFNLKTENIILGNGSDELITMLGLTYLNQNDEVLTSEHTFSEYEFTALLLNAKIKKVKMKNFTFNTDSLLKAINKKTKIIFIANPNNPTGTYISHEKIQKFIDQVPSKILIVLDEAYAEYATAKDYPQSLKLLKKYKNLVILRTFSKIYGLAGIRIGYGFANSEIIKDTLKVKQPFNINSIAEQIAILALEQDEFVKKSIELNEKGKKYLYTELKKLKIKFLETQGNFIFIQTPIPAKQMYEKIIKFGIISRALDSFDYPDAIRLTIGTEEQNRAFISALKTILEEK